MANTSEKSGPSTNELVLSSSDKRSETLAAPQSNRTVRLSLVLGQERLDIIGPEGATELSVILTEHGPKLVFESADIQIVTPNKVAVECRSFEVKAHEELELSGATASIKARRGDVKVEASDRVSLVGEQIRLNCDGPDQVPGWMHRELAAQLISTVMPSLVPRRDQTGDLEHGPPGPHEPSEPDKNAD